MVDSKRPYFTSGQVNTPSAKLYGTLQHGPEGNCTFFLYGSDAFYLLDEERLHTGTKAMVTIVKDLSSCDGRGFEPLLIRAMARQLIHSEVFISRLDILQQIKSVGISQKDFKISQEVLSSPKYVGVAQDLFEPHVWRLLSRFREFGILECFRKARKAVRLIDFLGSLKNYAKRNTTLKIDQNFKSGKEPIKLQVNHVRALMTICGCLLVAGIILFMLEFCFAKKY